MEDYIDHDFIDDYYEEAEEYDWGAHCLIPTLSDAFTNFYLPILIANLTARFLSIILDFIISRLHARASPVKTFTNTLISCLSYLHHVIFILSGLWLLHQHMRNESFQLCVFLIVILLFSGFSNALFSYFENIIHSRIYLNFCLKSVFFFFQFSYIALNEFEIHYNGRSDFIKLRPLLMLIVMKSVAFFKDQQYSDSKKSKNHFSLNPLPLLFNSFAYLLHPASIVLGVWHYSKTRPYVFGSFKELLQKAKFIFYRFSKCFIFTFLALSCSSCLIEYLEREILTSTPFEVFKSILVPIFHNQIVNLFDVVLTAYFVALKFHCSHFFICFAAESMFALWEIDLKVTKPSHILLPYSMVQLVISWNIPMHIWLKRYVFKPLHTKISTFVTILFTYLISSFLHGLNCQIWSVLLTLGICSQAEYVFRSKISRLFSACIASRPCSNNSITACDKQHHRSPTHPVTRLINLFFSMLVMANLAFLGSTFDGDPESSSCSNVYFIWSHLYYFPYIIAAIQTIFTLTA